MTETLEKVGENRDDNRKLLEQKKSSIIKQISTVKSKLLKYIDDLEERLTYDYPEYKLDSIQHHVDYKNNQSGRLYVFHSIS
jgi:uncharacterized protein YpuA (DUF1002 family)